MGLFRKRQIAEICFPCTIGQQSLELQFSPIALILTPEVKRAGNFTIGDNLEVEKNTALVTVKDKVMFNGTTD